MPRHSVINRRGAGLEKRSLSMSDEAFAALQSTAELLHVSIGSLADAAVVQLTSLPPREIAEVLLGLGWLTKPEHAKVLEAISKSAGDSGPQNEKEK